MDCAGKVDEVHRCVDEVGSGAATATFRLFRFIISVHRSGLLH